MARATAASLQYAHGTILSMNHMDCAPYQVVEDAVLVFGGRLAAGAAPRDPVLAERADLVVGSFARADTRFELRGKMRQSVNRLLTKSLKCMSYDRMHERS
jgi:hypothetical protein